MKNLPSLLFFFSVLWLASCKKEEVDAETQNFIKVQSRKYYISFSQVFKPGTSDVVTKTTIELRSVNTGKNIKLTGYAKNSLGSLPASFDMMLDSLVIDSLLKGPDRVVTQTYFYNRPIALSYNEQVVSTNKAFEVTAKDNSKRNIEFTFYLPPR